MTTYGCTHCGGPAHETDIPGAHRECPSCGPLGADEVLSRDVEPAGIQSSAAYALRRRRQADARRRMNRAVAQSVRLRGS